MNAKAIVMILPTSKNVLNLRERTDREGVRANNAAIFVNVRKMLHSALNTQSEKVLFRKKKQRAHENFFKYRVRGVRVAAKDRDAGTTARIRRIRMSVLNLQSGTALSVRKMKR